MGNCQCSHEDVPIKDIEEPNAISTSNEPALQAAVAALTDNGHACENLLREVYPESRRSGKLGTSRESLTTTARDLTADANLGQDDADSSSHASMEMTHVQSNTLRQSSPNRQSTPLSYLDLPIGHRASGRQVSCTSCGYEQYASQKDETGNAMPHKQQFLKIGRIASQRGCFVSMDLHFNKALLKQCGIDTSEPDIKGIFHRIHECMLESDQLDHSKVLGIFLPPWKVNECIGEKSISQYLNEDKNILPLLSLENGLLPQSKGVQLIDFAEPLDEMLALAVDNQMPGVRMHSVVKQANAEGIATLVNQQFDFAKRVMDQELLPILHISVEVKTTSKSQISRDAALAERRKCEEILFDKLLAALAELKAGERVAFNLTLPVKPNTYLSLVGHPNTVRVLATPIGYDASAACRALGENFGLVGAFGNVLMSGMSSAQSEEEFKSALESTLQSVYDASVAVPTREMQTAKVAHTAGFFACLDSTAGDIDKAMARYRLGSRSDYDSEEKVMDKLHEMRSRIYTNTKFSGSRVIGVLMSIDTMKRSIRGKPSAQYLWQKKQIVPFLKVDHGLRGEKDGVRLMQDIPKLDTLLSNAVEAGIYGIKACTMIKKPNEVGIKAAVAQQFALSRKVMEKELVPVLHIEVDSTVVTEDKQACEELLVAILGDSLMQLRPEQRIILWLSIPTVPNLYLPLRGHMNVIRIVGVSGGQDRRASCLALRQNYGTIGGFNRAFVQGMHSEQTHEELTDLIDKSCEDIFQSSREVSAKTIQTYKVSKQHAFFAALAHINAWKTEFNIAAQFRAGMSGRVAADWRGMFERIVTNPQFNSLHVVGVSLAREHLDTKVMALPVAKYLWEEKQMVTFVKIDVGGLGQEQLGVQLMQEADENELDSLLEYAASAGAFGTTALSKIRLPNSQGIREVVDQQIRWSRKVSSQGMVHLMMIFIDKGDAPEKEKCEKLLRQILLNALKTLSSDEAIVLNFILPSTPGLYDCFVSHPNVLRVLGSAGSYTMAEACEVLGENAGMVANFGTAMLDGLGTTQSYSDFTNAMRLTCSRIQKAAKPPGRALLKRMDSKIEDDATSDPALSRTIKVISSTSTGQVISPTSNGHVISPTSKDSD